VVLHLPDSPLPSIIPFFCSHLSGDREIVYVVVHQGEKLPTPFFNFSLDLPFPCPFPFLLPVYHQIVSIHCQTSYHFFMFILVDESDLDAHLPSVYICDFPSFSVRYRTHGQASGFHSSLTAPRWYSWRPFFYENLSIHILISGPASFRRALSYSHVIAHGNADENACVNMCSNIVFVEETMSFIFGRAEVLHLPESDRHPPSIIPFFCSHLSGDRGIVCASSMQITTNT